jgi:hypothetical protein
MCEQGRARERTPDSQKENIVEELEKILNARVAGAGLVAEVMTGDALSDWMVGFWIGDNTNRMCDILFKWAESSVLFRAEVSRFQLKMIEKAIDAADRYMHEEFLFNTEK